MDGSEPCHISSPSVSAALRGAFGTGRGELRASRSRAQRAISNSRAASRRGVCCAIAAPSRPATPQSMARTASAWAEGVEDGDDSTRSTLAVIFSGSTRYMPWSRLGRIL
eukprot:scaffold17701_cov31-Tisochrysis_lutea.AAC.1